MGAEHCAQPPHQRQQNPGGEQEDRHTEQQGSQHHQQHSLFGVLLVAGHPDGNTDQYGTANTHQHARDHPNNAGLLHSLGGGLTHCANGGDAQGGTGRGQRSQHCDDGAQCHTSDERHGVVRDQNIVKQQ